MALMARTPRRVQHIAVRHGLSVAHVATVDEAAQLMRSLREPSLTVPPPGLGNDVVPGLHASVRDAAHVMLDVLNSKFALHGRARTSLSTALRVHEVRLFLGVGSSLAEDTKHIGDAADAFRHLTPTHVSKVVSEFRSWADVQAPTLLVKNSFIHDVVGNDESGEDSAASAPPAICSSFLECCEHFDIASDAGEEASSDSELPPPLHASPPSSPSCGSPAASACASPACSPRCGLEVLDPQGIDAFLADKVTKISSALLRLARSRETLAAVRLQAQSQKCATDELFEIKAQLSQSEAGFSVIADDISDGLNALAIFGNPAFHDYIETARSFLARTPSAALVAPLPSIAEESDFQEPKKAKKKKEKKKTTSRS